MKLKLHTAAGAGTAGDCGIALQLAAVNEPSEFSVTQGSVVGTPPMGSQRMACNGWPDELTNCGGVSLANAAGKVGEVSANTPGAITFRTAAFFTDQKREFGNFAFGKVRSAAVTVSQPVVQDAKVTVAVMVGVPLP